MSDNPVQAVMQTIIQVRLLFIHPLTSHASIDVIYAFNAVDSVCDSLATAPTEWSRLMGYVHDGINYTELSKFETIYHSSWMEDLNRLLPQLSKSAAPIKRARLHAMKKAGTRMFVALIVENDHARIIGVVLVCRTELLVGTKDWIEDVVVDDAYWRRGISGRLMDLAEKASFESGAKSLNLTSNPDRGPARKMYGDRGYVLRDTGVFRLTPPT